MNDAVTSPDEATAALEALHAATPDHAAEEAEVETMADGAGPAEGAPEVDGAPDAVDTDEAGADGADRAAEAEPADDDHDEVEDTIPDFESPEDAAIAARALAIATAADRIGVPLPEAAPETAVESAEPEAADDGGAEDADGAESADGAEREPEGAPAEGGDDAAEQIEETTAGQSDDAVVLPVVSNAAVAAAALGVITAAERAFRAYASADTPEDAPDEAEEDGAAEDEAESADDEADTLDDVVAAEPESADADGADEPEEPTGDADDAEASAHGAEDAAATSEDEAVADTEPAEEEAAPTSAEPSHAPAAEQPAEAEAEAADEEPADETAADSDATEPAAVGPAAVGAAVAVAAGAAAAAAAAAAPSLTLPETATPEIASEEPGSEAGADDGAEAADRADAAEGTSRAAALLALAKGSLDNPRHLMIAAAAAVAVVWLGSAIWTTQALADDSTVGGVSVGGMSPSEARSAVEQSFATSLAQPVTVTAGDKSAQITPADSGVSVDARASVGRLTGFTLNPLTIIDRFGGDSVPATTSVDSAALTRSLNSHLGELSSGTVNAEISLQGTKPVVSPSHAGAGVDVEASVDGLSSDWPLDSSSITLAEGTTRPAVTDDEAQAYADTVITPVLSAPVTITADGATTAAPANGTLTLSPQQLAPMLRISSETGELSATVDPEALRQAVTGAMGSQIERAAVESGWTIEGHADATPQYVAPVDGLTIDTAALSTEIITTGSAQTDASQRTVTLPMTASAPSSTTAQADWGIKEVVGEYSTPFYEDAARTQNLTAGAAAINGEIIMPGATFSTNDALEPVDAAHGFTYSGVILNGVHTNAFGGGLSQIGTTVFNASYEAGMDDVEHHPHSYWFERYPAGREATLWSPENGEGEELDVKFANSTPYPALIQAWVADDQVHVRLWSTHYYDVSIVSGEKEGYTPIGTTNRSGPGCEPYGGGEGGFSITVTRNRKAPDGTTTEDVLHTTYGPDNAVTCSGGGGGQAQASAAQSGQAQSPGGLSQTSAQGQQAPSGGSSSAPDSAGSPQASASDAAPAAPQPQDAAPAPAPAPAPQSTTAD